MKAAPARGESEAVPVLQFRDAREALWLDSAGRPRCQDSREVLEAISVIAATGGEDAVGEIVRDGFLAGAAERYAVHVEPQMRLAGGRFTMGSEAGGPPYFQGESPPHQVVLAGFAVCTVPVTNTLYALFDSRRDLPRAVGDHPVVDVTWYDAALCAAWFGCLLPTEAQWEYACGAGSPLEWCCTEADLPSYAWYSENAGGTVHRVATRAANALGLFDFHGQVWEWCRDDYDPAFYAHAPAQDPVSVAVSARGSTPPPRGQAPGPHGPEPPDGQKAPVTSSPGPWPEKPERHKVTRGGSFCSLAEMCRTRFRFHEPAGFWAHDLGFRMVSTRLPGPGEDTHA
jgi:formylglycine-generating enzyme required for sulfatase activity